MGEGGIKSLNVSNKQSLESQRKKRGVKISAEKKHTFKHIMAKRSSNLTVDINLKI